jgi:pyruvate carboxylase subunit B
MEVWGGAVPDSVMRYLGENPWTRLESIHEEIGDISKLTALSRGRNLFGYAPYTDEIIDGFCRNAIQSGLGIMRIFDALNDVDNVKSTIKYVKQYGGIADCAVCYTVDPKYPQPTFWQRLMGKKAPQPVFTDEYFLDKAKQMAALGADMITLKDMSGLIPPQRISKLVKLFKQHINLPVDFHTHSTPGYGLASVYAAIAAGVDVVDTQGTKKDVLYAGYVDETKADESEKLAPYKGQSVVYTENMVVDTYLVIGTHSRQEDYEDGTGMFYIGG